MESQETSPYLYGKMIIVRGVEAIQWQRLMFEQIFLEELDVYKKRINLDPYLSLYITIN